MYVPASHVFLHGNCTISVTRAALCFLSVPQVLKLLKAGGKVNVAIAGVGATISNSKRTLTFAGFVNVVQSSQDERVLVGVRAAWDAGASAPVRLSFAKKPKVEVPSAATSASNGSSRSGGSGIAANGGSNGTGGGANGGGAVKTWKLALDDDDDDNDDGGGVFGAGAGGDDDDDDLVDEDALLENSAPVKRATESVSAWSSRRTFCHLRYGFRRRVVFVGSVASTGVCD